MPFKVVQTIERGMICISAVPSGWEKDGTLWWPPKSQMGVVLDENSVPKDKWKSFSCIVKRQFETYKEASEEAEKMEAETDTEQEDQQDTRKPQDGPTAFGDFNSILNVPNEIPQVGETITLDNCNVQTHSSVVRSSPDENTFIVGSISQGEASELIQNQRKIIAQLEKQAEDTSRILSQLAKHEAYFGELYSKMEAGLASDRDSHHNKNSLLVERFPPVKTIDELKALEENLKDPTFERKYISSMSTLCSRGTNMRGLTLCYRLIDFFFSRDLLLQCSWTGNSRNQNECEKTAFKFFERIRSTFFFVVHNSDQTFSKIECDQFFKRVLKNSKQRLAASISPQCTQKKSVENLKRKRTRSPTDNDHTARMKLTYNKEILVPPRSEADLPLNQDAQASTVSEKEAIPLSTNPLTDKPASLDSLPNYDNPDDLLVAVQ